MNLNLENIDLKSLLNNILTELSFRGSSIIFIIISLIIMRKIGIRFLKKVFSLKISKKNNGLLRQKETIEKLTINTFKYLVNIIGLMLIISVFIPITTIMASAGIITVIVTFAFQSMLADIVKGFFIIFEEMFLVGDIIEVVTYKGEVIEIGLRITKIRLIETGDIVLIPNSNIQNIVKFNIDK